MLKQIAIAVATLLALLPCGFCAADAPAHSRETWLLHLPGIGGQRFSDRDMMAGFRDAGFSGPMDVYNWTRGDPGLDALVAIKRNQDEAQKVADLITAHFRQNPAASIVLTGHSGGTGIAVWALEKLPADVKIDKLIFLASALSPEYDLSAALAHVSGHCYSFCSENDLVVLGVGTQMFGTIDGKKTDAAGRFGFCLPSGADEQQYEKLIQIPYNKSWLRYHNVGDHIGCMRYGFARNILAPMLFPLTVVSNAAAGTK